jgi:5-formyltetrahydrofolate cyclo-ligase
MTHLNLASTVVAQQKQQMRDAARARRQQQPHKDELSRQICSAVTALPEYAAAASVMLYVDFGDEVRTRQLLDAAWAAGKRVAVPYCERDNLHPYYVQSLDDLSPGVWGILEPGEALRSSIERQANAAQFDLILTPGVAFDRCGGRLGYGKGYYDRLLAGVPHVARIAIAFECQIFAHVPMTAADQFVDKIVTEAAVYETKRSRETG